MPAPTTPTKTDTAPAPFSATEWTKKHAAPYVVPYYLTVFGLSARRRRGSWS